MAKGTPKEPPPPEMRSFWDGIGLGYTWQDEFCAEHDGTIGLFEALTWQLDDLADYRILVVPRRANMVRVTSIAAGATIGALVGGILGYKMAPAIAGALGKLGVLGAAGTGTSIGALSGATLSGASLAAIGGSVAAGTLILTAVGAGLGATMGGVLVNAYLREIDFDIQCLQKGDSPALLFIDGFLTEDRDDNALEWQNAVRNRFGGHAQYRLTWEAGTLKKIGTFLGAGVTGRLSGQGLMALGAAASRGAAKVIGTAASAATVVGLLANPWHLAIARAQKAGVVLADLLARVRNGEFILFGHSLGARVIYYTLLALGTRQTERPCIRDVYLLGGAIGRAHRRSWSQAAMAVSGHIHNCWSANDGVLRFLYHPATAFLSSPAGLGPIECPSEKIRNWDVTDLVGGHAAYKNALSEILERIRRASMVRRHCAGGLMHVLRRSIGVLAAPFRWLIAAFRRLAAPSVQTAHER